MTAEELKKHVQTYADEKLPGWECADVSFRIKKLGDFPEERLLVLPPPTPPDSRP